MYDVKQKIALSLQMVDEFRAEVEAGNIHGFMILKYTNELKPGLDYDSGTISPFEWIGLLEFCKNLMSDVIAGDDEE